MLFIAILISSLFVGNAVQFDHRAEFCKDSKDERCKVVNKIVNYASKKPEDKKIQGVK